MKKIFALFPIISILFTLILNSCSIKTIDSKIIKLNKLQNGDLIFVGAQKENLSGAINRVTRTSKNLNFDHIGLIEKTKDSIFVLHATTDGGSKRENIYNFYTKNHKNNNQLEIYRLKKEFQYSIPNAITKAKTMLGKPYNWSYILNENQYYCSDFIERAFRNNKIFELIPMNFKNSETGKIDDFWINFYKKQGKNVPQDEPGTNPNQLANSDKLKKIGSFNL
ncbi:YiiX/YebB-like N1pC/P60 family cysteine hydrolase [Chishuiella sp.]|uniref:YiiX/YebB-like N1pC/P60 family cysteine hydrolase n=1 Tax=Chishuiella sp. TaxID=1969467 RepID=UPI0028A97D81|nr:YiiX/YebB-like N1pC/P60 family cysteine hydrolase [Chishuiella sp.]